MILRLRQGAADNDFTVKLRPATDQKFADPSAGREAYKCEVDLTGSGAIDSYSIRRPYTGSGKLAETGNEVLGILSEGQKKLLQQSRVAIDWTRVTKVAAISYTVWQIKSQPQFRKLTLELWEWPGGKALELSTKVGADAGPATYTALKELIKHQRLSLNNVQEAKTSIVLKGMLGSCRALALRTFGKLLIAAFTTRRGIRVTSRNGPGLWSSMLALVSVRHRESHGNSRLHSQEPGRLLSAASSSIRTRVLPKYPS